MPLGEDIRADMPLSTLDTPTGRRMSASGSGVRGGAGDDGPDARHAGNMRRQAAASTIDPSSPAFWSVLLASATCLEMNRR